MKEIVTEKFKLDGADTLLDWLAEYFKRDIPVCIGLEDKDSSQIVRLEVVETTLSDKSKAVSIRLIAEE